MTANMEKYKSMVTGGTLETYKNLYVQDGNPGWIEELARVSGQLQGAGLLKGETVAQSLKTAAEGGDYQRLQNHIDQDPIGWVTQKGNLEASMPDLQKEYPYLNEGHFREANGHAFEQAKQARALQEWAQKETWEKNYATLLDVALKKNEAGQIFTFKDFDQTLTLMKHDPANGKLALNPTTIETIRNNIQTRVDQAAALGRKQPEMSEAKWLKFGSLMEGIPGNPDKGITPGSTTYEDVAKQYGKFPDHLIAGLMGEIKNSEKAAVSGQQKLVWKAVNNFTRGLDKIDPVTSSSIKADISHMMTQENIPAEKWLDEARKRLSVDLSTSGNIYSKLLLQRMTGTAGIPEGFEDRTPGQPGATNGQPGSAPPSVPSGWKPTKETYQGKPVYLDENGKKKVWDGGGRTVVEQRRTKDGRILTKIF